MPKYRFSKWYLSLAFAAAVVELAGCSTTPQNVLAAMPEQLALTAYAKKYEAAMKAQGVRRVISYQGPAKPRVDVWTSNEEGETVIFRYPAALEFIPFVVTMDATGAHVRADAIDPGRMPAFEKTLDYVLRRAVYEVNLNNKRDVDGF